MLDLPPCADVLSTLHAGTDAAVGCHGPSGASTGLAWPRLVVSSKPPLTIRSADCDGSTTGSAVSPPTAGSGTGSWACATAAAIATIANIAPSPVLILRIAPPGLPQIDSRAYRQPRCHHPAGP